jgi:hypothetical protein
VLCLALWLTVGLFFKVSLIKAFEPLNLVGAVGCRLSLTPLLNLLNHAGFDRETAAYALLGVMIGLALGYVIGFYIPIPGVAHHKTVTPTIVNKTTITVPINATKTVTYISTTTVGGKVEAIAMNTTTVEVATTTVIHH